ncbi:hypothetical protein WA026_005087 [Henosepilachna vigintioctopunctata]|uniref:Protein sleepless n=1 Tax=Henosepilachna vigintioctopunctata TaxID=420089 RepID=A0AAW1UTM0_9CUCU
MVCYQCESNKSEIFPICQTNMLKIATRAEKQDLLYFCPPFADKYCFKLIEGSSNSSKVTRGCVGEHDSKGNLLKPGCVHFRHPQSILCLCDAIACNDTTIILPFREIFLMLCMIVLFQYILL